MSTFLDAAGNRTGGHVFEDFGRLREPLSPALKCRRCEGVDRSLSRICIGAPVSSSTQWLFHITNWSLYAMGTAITDQKVKNEYRDLRMMQDQIDGHPIAAIAAAWGCTARTASIHIKSIASECMRQAMTQTQGDPEHPATPRFTLEEFTTDPRGAMVAIMRSHIAAIEEKYPGVQ